MRYAIPILFAVAMSPVPAALAQGVPPLLIPAPPAPTLPPPVAPTPVPSAVTPLPSPSYGVPAGVTQAPLYGSGIEPTVRYRQPAKPRKIKRRPRISGIQ
ncbi:MAG: hypothetical protein QOF14_3294 [Hyphomicrobiales bacterium]|jgi:hypothetical protein|nr:hypothetical protein [Hyphomicrobiales bacterium]